jgi:CRP-like cAMP-binding protein
MYTSLLEYIRERSSYTLSEKDVSLIKEAFIPKKLRKRQFLLQEGDVCKYIAFIVKGATRQYTVDEKGDEHVLNLCKENDYYERVNNIPAFKEMRIKLDDYHHMASQKRLHSSINYTADYRYEELIKQYPEFIQRFPQHIIASYLGITKETLSRIRHQSVKK